MVTEAELYEIAKHAEVLITQPDSGDIVDQLGEDIPYNKVMVIYLLELENFGAGRRQMHIYKGHTADPNNVEIDTKQLAGDGSILLLFDGIKSPLYTIRPYAQDTQETPDTAIQWNQLGVTYEDTDPAGAANELHVKIGYYYLPLGR